MESTDDTNRDLEKATSIIVHIKNQLDYHQANLPNMTRADINYLRGRLDLLEYLLTPTSGTKIEPLKGIEYISCSVCKEIKSTIYIHRGVRYCNIHLPVGITQPIGMHGDDLKTYKERK